MTPQETSFVIFCSHYLPHVGGIEYYVSHLAKELKKKGFLVYIVTGNTNNNTQYVVKDKVPVYRLSSFLFMNGRFPVPYKISEITKIKKRFFSENTVVILNTRFFLISFLGVILAKLTHSRAILIDHGSGHFDFPNKITTYLSRAYEHIITFFIKLARPDFYGVSLASNTWLKHFDIRSKGVVVNGVDFKEKKYQKKFFILSRKFQDKKMIFAGGRLVAEKGIVQLISACQSFCATRPDYMLFIAGAGPMSEYVKEKARNRKWICYAGELEHDLFCQLLSKAAVLLYPSNYPEGLPTLLLEAAKYKIPIISTPKGGAKEIIHPGKTGTLIKEGSVSEILNGLTQFEASHKKARQMAENLYKTVKKDYNWSVIVEKFLRNIKL